MRRSDPRWLIVTLANLLLWWLTGLLNHYLAGFAVHFYLGGLLLAYASLRLDPKQGLIAMVLTSLLVDALDPVPFGTSLFLFSLVHLTVLVPLHPEE